MYALCRHSIHSFIIIEYQSGTRNLLIFHTLWSVFACFDTRTGCPFCHPNNSVKARKSNRWAEHVHEYLTQPLPFKDFVQRTSEQPIIMTCKTTSQPSSQPFGYWHFRADINGVQTHRGNQVIDVKKDLDQWLKGNWPHRTWHQSRTGIKRASWPTQLHYETFTFSHFCLTDLLLQRKLKAACQTGQYHSLGLSSFFSHQITAEKGDTMPFTPALRPITHGSPGKMDIRPVCLDAFVSQSLIRLACTWQLHYRTPHSILGQYVRCMPPECLSLQTVDGTQQAHICWNITLKPYYLQCNSIHIPALQDPEYA